MIVWLFSTPSMSEKPTVTSNKDQIAGKSSERTSTKDEGPAKPSVGFSGEREEKLVEKGEEHFHRFGNEQRKCSTFSRARISKNTVKEKSAKTDSSRI